MDTKQAKDIIQIATAGAGAAVTCIQAVSMVKHKLEQKKIKPVRKIGF